MADPSAVYDRLLAEVQRVLIGNEAVVEGLTIALLVRGHVLLEGVPGVAKTTLANCFARASGLDTNRVQMTPDILPADITGTHIYREESGEFRLQRGPIFANIVVADEINRASPKTQSALLEGMQEKSVTIEGETLSLPIPFMVVATQNPIEMEGTYELPEAQRDRFHMKLHVGIPDGDRQRALIDRFDTEPNLGPSDINQVVDVDDIMDAREQIQAVHVDGKVKAYIMDIAEATRSHDAIEFGASPRATLALLDAAKARAALNGRDYVIPDDIKALAERVLAHRLVRTTEAELGERDPRSLIREIIEVTPTPESKAEDDSGTRQAVSGDGGQPADY